jgi:heat shock protein HslJ
MPGGPPARRRGLLGLRLLVTTLALAVAGCALVPTPWVGGWRLRTIGGNPAAAQATIVFTATDVVLETGCNQGAGQYEMANGKLTLKDVAFTAVGCLGAVATQDAAFVALAGGTPSLSVSGDTLTIDAGGGRPVLVFDRTSGA